MPRADQTPAARPSRPDITSPCLALAAVARLRAEEQARLAAAADDDSETARHREQQDHLLALAGEYERLAVGPAAAVREVPASDVRVLTIAGDPFR